MSKQIIFCVETNGKARTDIVYIKDTIRKFYNDYSGINFEYVPMGTKTAFNNKKTKADIRKYINKGFPKCGTIYSFTLGNLAFWIISFI